jgi:hypothetical protein
LIEIYARIDCKKSKWKVMTPDTRVQSNAIGGLRTRALITGASSGLGLEFADLLSAQHIDLVLEARTKEPVEQLSEGSPLRHRSLRNHHLMAMTRERVLTDPNVV